MPKVETFKTRLRRAGRARDTEVDGGVVEEPVVEGGGGSGKITEKNQLIHELSRIVLHGENEAAKVAALGKIADILGFSSRSKRDINDYSEEERLRAIVEVKPIIEELGYALAWKDIENRLVKE